MPRKLIFNPLSGDFDYIDTSIGPRTEEGVCATTDSVGDCVKVVGTRIAGKLDVRKVDITVAGDIPSIGIIISKATSTTCTVQLDGIMSGVVTGLTPGKAYFISPTSTLTLTPTVPTSGNIAWVQQMGEALDTDEFLIQPKSPTKRVG